ncbi:hypothetical protein INT43_004736 [Umbelopsis isabellina]|uniref:Uncharacterized protein n=1 Tax=Mortierella isabellina TaxID=91625 RepID=A0A8H7U9H3_MORIS|nr:hypothetical protein INT43_004736 [Umbelopsis isabellina]
MFDGKEQELSHNCPAATTIQQPWQSCKMNIMATKKRHGYTQTEGLGQRQDFSRQVQQQLTKRQCYSQVRCATTKNPSWHAENVKKATRSIISTKLLVLKPSASNLSH